MHGKDDCQKYPEIIKCFDLAIEKYRLLIKCLSATGVKDEKFF